MNCPVCHSADVRKATVFWQCLTCSHEWLVPSVIYDRDPGDEDHHEVMSDIWDMREKTDA